MNGFDSIPDGEIIACAVYVLESQPDVQSRRNDFLKYMGGKIFLITVISYVLFIFVFSHIIQTPFALKLNKTKSCYLQVSWFSFDYFITKLS